MTGNKFARTVGFCAVALLAMGAKADVVYSNIPAALPGNLPSLGYEATSTSEFGDHIGLAGTARGLQKVTVTMSDWALASDYGSTATGYNKDLTLNVYGFTGNSVAGPLLGTLTVNAFIPWRPAASLACTGGQWSDGNGNCYSGYAFNVDFDFSSMGIVLPNDVVIGLAFDTQDYGAHPTGVAGPSNSLNFAFAGAPTVGSDINSDGVFWNTSHQGFLTTGTAGVFGQDTDWTGYVPAMRIEAAEIPEPTSLALAGLALAAAGVVRRRRA